MNDAGASVAPRSTYRLQISADFTLDDAVGVVGYLARLGVGALYLSPLLRAAEGSTHGYDVVDHTMVDPARGGPGGLRRLSAACREAGLGLVVDIVPNHMSVADARQNAAWWDLLRGGTASSFARWFDVDWEFTQGKVNIPVLGDEADIAALALDGSELVYGPHRYPVAPGTAAPGERPEAVHRRQHYALIGARRAETDQNYRRFFSVADLAGLRVEDPAVHRATHAEIVRWVRGEGVTGLRVDHPDGLSAPGPYLERLAASVPGTWVVVEKITEAGETIPASWPVAGTTGYDALAEVNAVLVDPAAEAACDAHYRRLTGDTLSWPEHVAAGKRQVASTILQAEIRRLARLVPGIPGVEEALRELAVAFPVYRSYLPEGVEHLAVAARRVGDERPELAPALRAVWPRLTDAGDELAVRFEQVTGAVMAKGVEDTAFYRYSRQLGLNEVGASPGRFGWRVEEFHAAQSHRAARAPATMTALSTHDTKRGEDLRARLAVLAELPDEWAATAGRLQSLVPVPDRALGHLLWQTVVATGLIERDRLHGYMEKAMREAGRQTSWRQPDAAFEGAVHRAVDAAYHEPAVRQLITEFSRLVGPFGWSNSLAQKLIQLTMPGVPDLYQGSESFEGSLVDPDNRRPVDFTVAAAALDELDAVGAPPARADTPEAKLWVTSRTLRLRRDHPELFVGYRPLRTGDPLDHHLVAFDRGGAVTLATRLPVGLGRRGGWGTATLELAAGPWHDVLTGRRFDGSLRLADVLDRYPVALVVPLRPSPIS